MNILGISCFYHDAAAALVKDGHILAAAQEERFTRCKHDPAFPTHAATYCLSMLQGGAMTIDAVAYYEKPSLKYERQQAFTQKGHGVLGSTPTKYAQSADRLLATFLIELGINPKLVPVLEFTHHSSHAAAAFFPSPFPEAAIATMDGVGEWETLSIASGRGDTIEFHENLRFPDSIGLLYAAFTDFCGFKVNSGEYKLMGLAPYGTPVYKELILETMLVRGNNTLLEMNREYFSYVDSQRMTSEKFAALFGVRPRRPAQRLSQKYMDIAASIQAVTEDLVLDVARRARELTGMDRLCLAGGVALNCVANSKLLHSGIFDDIWIQPAAGDAGSAVGAACLAYLKQIEANGTTSKTIIPMNSAYLGPDFEDKEVLQAIDSSDFRPNLSIQHFQSEAELVTTAATDLYEGKAVGWFQGRMEFGPRALGARSILANPMLETTQRDLNLKVKFRESFRPFAPVVKAESSAEWFSLERESPYMLLVAPIAERYRLPVDESSKGLAKLYHKRSIIPAVTHVDYSARLQTVSKEQNPRLHAVLSAFESLTSCPVLVNTSFNVRGEPIVCTPEDAMRCFCGTNIEVLYIENYRVEKTGDTKVLDSKFSNQFEKD
ncbi:carbamoyltransferase family protein [Okeania hirsuta]|uniref:Carbamoyltransferase n=1 Tax=Okeania hirsuta TaxID=1458930 RepID=A0A3N6RGV0_9CYAN|nr:carbamoyltransferase [Okeania hirsuta]RQH23990.1 hypothetical protein D4Z78_05130 [Okeania hirsuta]RQH29539.1 hypothetical protein D5R40_24685 [Okeania hirsuta]